MSLSPLNAYLKHVGNCGASNLSPIDEKCICGLRQIYFKLNVLHTKMQSVTRYIQRSNNYDSGSQLEIENLSAAKNLASEL